MKETRGRKATATRRKGHGRQSPPKRHHVAVVGSANVDLTTFIDNIPRPGETIFGRGFHLGFGGKGANQAVAAAMCGARVSMVARVGDDLFGPATIQNLAARGVDTAYVKITPGVSTGVAPILVDATGQNRIWVVKGANNMLRPADVDAAADVLATADCIVLQLEIPIETVYYTLHFAEQRGIRSILNPAPAQAVEMAEIARATYVIPNETEAEALGGCRVRKVEDARACAKGILKSGFNRAILTLGAAGAILATRERVELVPSIAVRPVDTTGAGDAFIGAFATFLAQGCEEMEAVARANVYAALSTTAKGTQSSFATPDQFRAAWEASRTAARG